MEPTDLHIRPGEPDDAAAVAAVHLAARRAAEPAMPPVAHSESEVVEWLSGSISGQLAGAHSWVATYGDEVIGFATVRGGWLDNLYVAPEHQRRGVGAALLQLVQHERPDGFELWVFVANEAARAFYRRHGLVELEQTDGSGNEERTPDVRMAWLGEDPLRYLRRRIDDVDDELAVLLARRVALSATAQDHKEVGGQAGRDPDRETEIVDRMAGLVPGLSRDHLARVMHAVIAESLAAWEERT